MKKQWFIAVAALFIAAGFSIGFILSKQTLPSSSASSQTQTALFSSPEGQKLQRAAASASLLETILQTSLEHAVQPGDSLGRIAKQCNTTIDLIKKMNQLDTDLIRVGEILKVPNGRFSVLVSKSKNTLDLFLNETTVKSYAVSTGKDNSTPVGEFTIASRLENPVWYKTGAVIPPGSPDNILGTRWLGFSLKGYGIHGTVEPDKIGQAVTAGCIRMRNEDVEELYAFIPVGSSARVQD